MTIPSPRAGLIGWWDRFIGPGATQAEQGLILLAGLAGAVMQLGYSLSQLSAWPWWQHGLAALLMFDILGGVVANATVAARRWYHRPGHKASRLLLFVASHGVHLAVVALLFRSADWLWLAGAYLGLLSGALLVLSVNVRLKRPVALLGVATIIVLNAPLLGPTPGLDWLLPLLFLKLLYSHLVPD